MTIKVFASGQSNALGRMTGGPDWSGIHTGVRVWNNVNPLGINGSAFVSAITARAGGTFQYTDRNNFCVWFCDRLCREQSEDVDLTLVARGDSSIARWSASEVTYPMLQECIDVWAATGQGPADIFLWHQGEANASTLPATYSADFLTLLDALESGGVISPTTRVIVGGLADGGNVNYIDFTRTCLAKLPDYSSRIGFAYTSSVPVGDPTHFSGEGLYVLGGDRYFTAYKALNAEKMYALVNAGGHIGSAGTGQLSVYDITADKNKGYRLKSAPIFIEEDRTYYPSEGTAAIYVEVVGGGGGGGFALGTDGYARPASGGSAGAYAATLIESPLESYDVVIGVGGAGGVTNGVTGSGGATLFGVELSAPGGGGGADGSSSVADSFIRNRGNSSGVPATGNIRIAGERGYSGMKLTASSRAGGFGGRSNFGDGGGSAVAGSANSATDGGSASGYGAGGGGGVSSITTNAVGGNGSAGLVVVWEYVR